jgi:hypothetical protein
MATLTLTIVSGLGTDNAVLTFSAGDATRIFNAYKNIVNPNGVQSDLVAWMASKAKEDIVRLVMQSETTVATPTPPVMT